MNKVAKDNQIKAIKTQLSKSNKQYQAAFSDLTAKAAALAKDITFNSTQLTSLKSDFEELNKKESLVMDTEEGVTSDTGGSFTNESVATITVGVVDEQREREKRKLNLVLHNVPESTKQSGPERKADDISKVEKLLHDHLGINPTISNAIRWEKSPIDLDYLKFLLQQSKKNQLFYEIVTSSDIIAILRVSRQSLQHLT